MSDQKFDPRKELASLRDTVGKVIEKGSQTAGKIIEQGIQTVQAAAGGGSAIRLDAYELENEVIIRTAPIDGLLPESIEVSMEGTTLLITGETREESLSPRVNYLVRERKFGVFQRSLTITIPLKAQQAKAKLAKNGTLTITIPIDVDNYTSINVDDDGDE
ncbi:MAG: Hsp20/alpha crystallin family protein [Anaerolineae bacterium]|jgi:HSP20 family protein|nr:Hsp20/alpha crystallin family protein [Anaerolineae bacterium]